MTMSTRIRNEFGALSLIAMNGERASRLLWLPDRDGLADTVGGVGRVGNG
jgi:hypothetical protein